MGLNHYVIIQKTTTSAFVAVTIPCLTVSILPSEQLFSTFGSCDILELEQRSRIDNRTQVHFFPARSILRQVQNLFQSKFSIDCGLVLSSFNIQYLLCFFMVIQQLLISSPSSSCLPYLSSFLIEPPTPFLTLYMCTFLILKISFFHI